MGFKMFGGEPKLKVLSSRYKKRGRPRKQDYEFLTLSELQYRYNDIFNKRLDSMLNDQRLGVV